MTTANLTYVRWRSGEPRRGRIFPAVATDHPAYGAGCLMCDQPMIGQPIQLIAIGLTDEEDADDAAKAKRGEWFAAGAAIVHADCAAKMDDPELDIFAASLTPVEVAE